MILLQVGPSSLVDSVQAMLTAFLLAFPLAWNREQGRRRMGLRTMPLIAMASCGQMLIGLAFGAAVGHGADRARGRHRGER